MDHLILLIMLFALILGTWAAVYAFQFYKIYGNSFLRFLVHYIFFLNLAVFLYLVSKYLFINFPESLFTDPKSAFYTIVFLLATLVEIGLIHSYVFVAKRSRQLQQIKPIFYCRTFNSRYQLYHWHNHVHEYRFQQMDHDDVHGSGYFSSDCHSCGEHRSPFAKRCQKK